MPASSSTRRFARWASRRMGRSSRSGLRKPDGPSASDIGIWAVPVLGGQPRPYLEGVAEFDWSADGARLVYHTPGPGDPMFVSEPAGERRAGTIFSAPAGLHSHFLVWSRDGQFIYFVQGSVPDRMDIWRIRPDGGSPERITNHDREREPSRSSWIRADADVPRRRRGRRRPLDPQPRRRAACRASPHLRHRPVHLACRQRRRPASRRRRWPVRKERSGACRSRTRSRTCRPCIASRSPRRPGFVRGWGRAIWFTSHRRAPETASGSSQGDAATEMWSAPGARIIGSPAIAPGGQRMRSRSGRTVSRSCTSRTWTARARASSSGHWNCRAPGLVT